MRHFRTVARARTRARPTRPGVVLGYRIMASITVPDLPSDAHAVLGRRALSAGMSLPDYVRSRLVEEALRPTLEEVLELPEPPSGETAAVVHLRAVDGLR